MLTQEALTWKGLRRGQLGIAAWRVNTADLNEAGHQHDQRNAHQEDRPPVCLEWQRIKRGLVYDRSWSRHVPRPLTELLFFLSPFLVLHS